MLNRYMPDGCNCEGTEWMQERLGTYQNRPRPIRLIFKSMDIKQTVDMMMT